MEITNLEKLEKIVDRLSYHPFFLFKEKEKEGLIKDLKNLFSSLSNELGGDKTIKKIVEIIEEKDFNEFNFSKNLKDLLSNTSLEDNIILKKLTELLTVVINKSKPFYLAKQVSLDKDSLTEDKTKEHNKNIISVDMQLYALDYFLLMHKTISEDGNEHVILKSVNNLPSLLGDALGEDMLKKIVFTLFDYTLLIKMVRDYYRYKEVFYDLTEDTKLTKEKIGAIKESLKSYIFSLIEVSENIGVLENNNGMYLPYGKISFSKLREILNKK